MEQMRQDLRHLGGDWSNYLVLLPLAAFQHACAQTVVWILLQNFCFRWWRNRMMKSAHRFGMIQNANRCRLMPSALSRACASKHRFRGFACACTAVHFLDCSMSCAEAVVVKATFREMTTVEAMPSSIFACFSAGVSAGIQDPNENLEQSLLCCMNHGK